MTGIPTRKIVIESSLPNDLDLKTYFKSALDDNVKQLLSTITGSSSFINSVKKKLINLNEFKISYLLMKEELQLFFQKYQSILIQRN